MLRNKNKGFSLIELIVVIAIIGILVMLAAPRFLGYTEKARVARIQNDIKVVEGKVAEEYINTAYKFDGKIDSQELDDMIGEYTIYAVEGKVQKGNIEPGNYKIVEATQTEEARTKLAGTFYNNSQGKVYYVDDKSDKGDVTGDNEADENGCPVITCNIQPLSLTGEMEEFLSTMGPFPDNLIVSFYEYNGKTIMFDFRVEDGEIIMAMGVDFDILLNNPPESEEDMQAMTLYMGVDEGDGFKELINAENIPLPNCYKNIVINEMDKCNKYIGESNIGNEGSKCPIGKYVFEDYYFTDIVDSNLFKLDSGKFLEANLEINPEDETFIDYKIIDTLSQPTTDNEVIEITIDNKGANSSHRYGYVKLEEGKVYTKGPNISGTLGINESNHSYYQAEYGVAILENVKEIRLADSGETGGGIYALMENGDVYVWGANYTYDGSFYMKCPLYGIIGAGNSVKFINSPTKLITNGKVKKIETHFAGAIILTESGDVYSTGTNSRGYLGLGREEYCEFAGELTKISNLTNIVDIMMLNHGTESVYFAKSTNGNAYKWGWLNDSPKIIEHKIFELYQEISNWSSDYFYIYEDNVYRLSNGNENFLHVSIPDYVNANPVKLFIKDSTTFVLMDDGTIWAKGNNYAGELLDGTIDKASSLVKVGVVRGCEAPGYSGPPLD